jgi:hypothetical protein
MKSSTAVESTAAMAAATLSERRRGHTKKHERKNCNENYRQGLLHFSPSNPTHSGLPGRNKLPRGTLALAAHLPPHLTPAPRFEATLLPTQTATRKSLLVQCRPLGRHLKIRFPNPANQSFSLSF